MGKAMDGDIVLKHNEAKKKNNFCVIFFATARESPPGLCKESIQSLLIVSCARRNSSILMRYDLCSVFNETRAERFHTPNFSYSTLLIIVSCLLGWISLL